MSLKLERLIKRRKTEIIFTIVLFIFAISLVLLAQGSWSKNLFIQLGERLGFSILVALIVRLLSLAFSELEESDNTDRYEYHEAIQTAHKRIWIYQTWLPGIQRDAIEIVDSKASDVRILLASFKEGSPIYARIRGRGMKLERGKTNVANSTDPFVERNIADRVRFNHNHHPAWIAIIDSSVFWGPTPIDTDSHAVEYLFRKHPINSREGEFWKKQFELLWSDSHSHSFDCEKQYNEQL
ncbi:hypothetical protein NDA01_24640 [Trichocoleus desertorum AS-A10]|uniref:hypothetical protein n=1 Tax=Trichocoleus desertorum TaxID=1481672 RepID=UPI00329A06EA